MLDILIKNGTVFDGQGQAGKKLDIAIQNGKITNVAPNIQAQAAEIIDATGRFVAPGFIDIQNHSDSYWTLFEQPEQSSMLSQGITTIVVGNCGASAAPLANREALKALQKWRPLSGVNIDWVSMAELFAHLKQSRLGVNVGSLVGHATLRRGLLGDEVRHATNEEIKIMEKLLRQALDEGALGLSLGLVYAHETDATKDELMRLTSHLKPANKVLNVHLRSEGSHILEAIDEAIDLARAFQVPLKISHLKIRGQNNWHLFGSMMNRLETAYHQGLKVYFDLYPYDTTWAVLYTYLPKWAYEGGRLQILKHLQDPVARRKILDYLNSQLVDYSKIIVASDAGSNAFVGKSLSQIAENQSVSGSEALLNILSASDTQVVVFDHNLSDEQVGLLIGSPLSLIGTDGAGYSLKEKSDLIHPRCFGTMPRFLRLVREGKLMKWEEAIQKLTGEPAKFLGLPDRGVIAARAWADVVIFDPNAVADKTDYRNPDFLPAGIDTVLVNGQVAFAGGVIRNLKGQVITR